MYFDREILVQQNQKEFDEDILYIEPTFENKKIKNFISKQMSIGR